MLLPVENTPILESWILGLIRSSGRSRNETVDDIDPPPVTILIPRKEREVSTLLLMTMEALSSKAFMSLNQVVSPSPLTVNPLSFGFRSSISEVASKKKDELSGLKALTDSLLNTFWV